MALGASHQHLLLALGRRGALLGAAGTFLGIGVALASARLLRALLPVGASLDVRILAVSALTLFAIALGATLVPAWRARHVDPMIALRAD